MAKASGQITIVDYNDALTLSSFISSNLVKTQVYSIDEESFTPDWSIAPYLVLSLSLYKAGSTSDIIESAGVQSINWYEYVNGVQTLIAGTSTRVISGTKGNILTIKSNELELVDAKDYIARVVYKDPATNLDIIQLSSISFSKLRSGSGLLAAIASTPNGNIFKNNLIESLVAKIELWRGSGIDTSLLDYQWYKQDTSVVLDEGGGLGWKKLTNEAGVYTGVTAGEMTIYPSAFTNIGVFKASIEDVDTGSDTYGHFYWDTVTFVDNTDPIQVVVTSTGGDIFKNGIGTTVLSAKLYQAGYEVDIAGAVYTYKWYKYDKDGVQDPDFGGSGIAFKTGKTLQVTAADVEIKSTFLVEVI